MEKNLQNEFLEYFEPLREKLYRYVRALCKNEELTKDIVSDTILQAYEQFDKIRNKQAFLSFLFTIASRSYKRYNWRRRFFGEYDEKYAENLKDYSSSTDLNYDVQILYEALDKLNDKTKQAIILFEISGFSIKEISELQKSSDSTVKSRLLRGRKKLKELLEVDFDDATQEFQEINMKEKKIILSEIL